MLFWRIFCPKCRRPIDHHLWHIKTSLGARIARCPKCRTEISSGRWEWVEFTGGRKMLYRFLTVLYAVFFAALGAGVGELAHRVTPSLAVDSPEILGIKLYPTIAAGLFSAVLVILVQLYRVKASRRRAARGPEVVQKAGLFNFQTDLQGKFALIFVLAFLAAAAPYVHRKSREGYAVFKQWRWVPEQPETTEPPSPEAPPEPVAPVEPEAAEPAEEAEPAAPVETEVVEPVELEVTEPTEPVEPAEETVPETPDETAPEDVPTR